MSFVELRRKQIERSDVAAQIAAHLIAFEEDLGRALASGCRLVGSLPDARRRASISAVVGQDAISSFVGSLSLISKAMEEAVRGHLDLDQARCDLRLPEVAGGDKIPLPVQGQQDCLSPVTADALSG